MLGRLLALVGIAMIAFGIFGIVRSAQTAFIPNFDSLTQLGTDTKAREALLCKSGEKLEEDKGPSEYDAVQGHYASSVTLYCVNDAGTKRDVTAEFANKLVGQIGGVFGSVGSIFSGILGTTLYFALIGIGFTLTIIGLVFSRRRAMVVSYGVPIGSSTGFATFTTTPQNSGASIDLNQIIQQARSVQGASSADLSTRLKQLEDALKAGLITQTEYDRTRQQILDTLK